MVVKELMKFLSHFPANYDVRIPTVPECEWTPFFSISDNGKGQIWIYPLHYAGDNPNYAELTIDERGNFVKKEVQNENLKTH